jgi:hypothetical protein
VHIYHLVLLKSEKITKPQLRDQMELGLGGHSDHQKEAASVCVVFIKRVVHILFTYTAKLT